MLEILALANKNSYKIFLLGSTPRVISLSISRINREFPRLKIQGKSGPKLDQSGHPLSKINSVKEASAIAAINKFVPDILFIAFGAPKQELWLARHISKLKVGGAMVVGGSLNYFSGQKPLPPEWMASLGLEWAWRLLHERGHAKRVLNALVVFPALIVKERLS